MVAFYELALDDACSREIFAMLDRILCYSRMDMPTVVVLCRMSYLITAISTVVLY
jgi:hypothetical protein